MMPITIPMYDTINAIDHAHPLPFSKPKLTTKCAIPIAIRTPPTAANAILNSGAIAAIARGASPPRR